MMHTGLPIFYRLTLEGMGIDTGAVQRQHGLELMLKGHAELAFHMGPQETMASPIEEITPSVLLCHACALDDKTTIMAILARMHEKDG